MTTPTTKSVPMTRMKTNSRFPSCAAVLRRLPTRVWSTTPPRVRSRWRLLSPLLVLVISPGAYADKHAKKPTIAVERIAQGQVINNAKQPVTGAIVYLENPTSLQIKSYLTDNNGHFHFTQLAAQTDYEVWAEQNGVESKHKFISQFSSHTHFDFKLKLTPEKKKLLGFL